MILADWQADEGQGGLSGIKVLYFRVICAALMQVTWRGKVAGGRRSRFELSSCD